MFYWRTVHSSVGALIHRQQTIYCIFFTHKTKQHLQTRPYCHLIGLDETSTTAYNLGETQSCNYLSILLFGCEDSWDILASVWQEEKNFEVLKRCYIQIYPANFLLCYGKSFYLSNKICKIERNTTW